MGGEGVARKRFIRRVVIVGRKEEGEGSDSATSQGQEHSGDGGYDGWDVSSMTADDSGALSDAKEGSPSEAGAGQGTSPQGPSQHSGAGESADATAAVMSACPSFTDMPWSNPSEDAEQKARETWS